MRIVLAQKVVAAVTLIAAVAFAGRAARADCSAAHGQHLIDTGQYQQAIDVFTCVIAAHPTGAEGGTPVAGGDDDWFYFAELDWVAEVTGTYLLQVTFFESVNYGEVVVTRN